MDSENRTCQRAACGHRAVAACAYTDRRGRTCGSQWCIDHLTEVAAAPYCARHASTVVAVGPDAIAMGHLPELDNRVPSLVYWVGRDLDADVPALLVARMDPALGESLVVEPVALVTGGGRTQQRRWERNWKIVSHTGISERVTVAVHEDAPTTVVLRVGQREVRSAEPPWIRAHADAGTDDPEVDAVGRRSFYRELHNAVASAIR